MTRLTARLCLLLLLTGCGIKGPLQPKSVALPAAVGELQLLQQGEELVLLWRAPTANQDGSTLTDLAGFNIYRLSYLPEDYCDECRDPQFPVASLVVDDPNTLRGADGSFRWRDHYVAVGSGYRYTVLAMTTGDLAGAATKIHRVVLPPPPSPAAFSAIPLDRGARLNWTRPAELDPAAEWLGVQVYRGSDDGPLQPLPGEARLDDHYDDFGLENGQSYRYGLRSVVRINGQPIASDMGEVITVVPDAGL